jgi:hypothetical protein
MRRWPGLSPGPRWKRRPERCRRPLSENAPPTPWPIRVIPTRAMGHEHQPTVVVAPAGQGGKVTWLGWGTFDLIDRHRPSPPCPNPVTIP